MAPNTNQPEIFIRNLNALAEFHPHVSGCLDEASPFQLTVGPSESGILNLFVCDSTEGKLPLYPQADPVKDIQGIVKRLSDTKGRVVCLMGFGLGYHAEEIIEHIGAVNIILLYEAHPAILKEAMRHSDLTHIFSHRHVRMVVGHPAELSSLLKNERDILFAGDKHILVEMKRMTALSPEWYETEKRRIQRFVQGVIISNRDMAAHGKRYFENRFRNLLAMSESIPLGALKDRMVGKPAIIVASGPSLSKNIEKLKDAKGKALILAADSAVAPMLQHGIMPDIVVSVDINDFTFEKLSPFTDRLKETGLLFIPEVTPKIPNYIDFGFKISTVLSPHSAEFFNELLGTEESPLMHAQSVVHLALGAAQRMGCDPIIFTGLDLAYDREKDHADGTVLHWGNRQQGNLETDLMVESVHGEMIPTNVGLLNIRETCEKLIRVFPDRDYIDATEGGAKIAGTGIKTLSEVIDTRCREVVDTSVFFKLRQDASSIRIVAKRIEETSRHVNTLIALFPGYWECATRINASIQKNDGGAISNTDNFFAVIREDRNRTDAITAQMNADPVIAALTDILAGSVDEYIEHEIQKAEAESIGDEAAIFIARFEQQKFAQKIRENACSALSENIDRLLRFFNIYLSPEKEQLCGCDSTQHKLSICTLLYDYGLIAKAEGILKKLPKHMPQVIFLLGSVWAKIGKVRQGLEIINENVSNGLLPPDRIDAFTASMEAEWLAACGPNTPCVFRKIMADRVLMLPSITASNRQEILNLIKSNLNQLVYQNNIGAVIELLSTALDIHFANDPFLTTQLAKYLLKTGQYDAGVERLVVAVMLDPNAAILWEEIGDTLFAGEDYEASLSAYEKCCSALPERLSVFRKIGDCYMANGKAAAAKIAYTAALGNSERSASTNEN